MAAVPDPEISYAVILTRGADRAAAAIRSIAAQRLDFELLLVLNEADDEMRAYARTLAADGARILHDGLDIGVVYGWNLALREARSDRVCIVHEDAELHPGCVARLLRTLRERPDAGAVAPRVILSDGSEQDGAIIWRDGAGSRMAPSPTPGIHAVDYTGSSCLMLRRDAVLGVGGFDERFFPAIYADATLSVALWQAGRTCLCDGRAVHVHHTAAMVDEARGPRRSVRFRAFLVERNRARFRRLFAAWLAEQAPRADARDATRATLDEMRDAQARASARERRVLSAPLAPLEDRLRLPADLEAAAAQLRRGVEDEFMAELVAREAALTAEAAQLHGAYATLHAELDRVHSEHAGSRAELDRVHRAYAELWQDRERLRDLAKAPALAKEDHA